MELIHYLADYMWQTWAVVAVICLILELMNGDCIRIRKSDSYFHLIERDSFSYFENISNKLY